MTTPRGIRNRNPGNIRYVEGVTSTYLGCIGSDGAFCQFDTDEHGIRALCRQLLSYQTRHGLRTVRGCINRWAPPVENDTSAYVTAVARGMGIGPDDQLDLTADITLAAMATQIIQHENGQQPYATLLIKDAALSALGKTVERVDAAPVEERTVQPQEKAVDPLSAIALFGPMISQLIPQVAKLFDKSAQTPEKLTAASAVVDTIVKATGAPNAQGAVEAMSKDPAVLQMATQAVVTNASIMELLEVGGGIERARAVAADPTSLPFWRQGAFVISVLLTPLIYMVVYKVLWGTFSEQLQTVVVTAILSGLLGALTGFFFGSQYTSRQASQRAGDAKAAA